jgi:anti-sigma-K factor RskA
MTCAELRDLAPLYALGALTPEERLAVERHLAEPIAHEGCADAIRNAVDAAALLARALPPAPVPAGSWEALDASLGTEADTGGQLPAVRRVARPRWDLGRMLQGRALIGVLALLLVIVVGVRIARFNLEQRQVAVIKAHLNEQDEALRGCLGELLAMKRQLQLQQMALDLLDRPGTEMVSLAVQGKESYRANVILNQPEKKAVIVAGALRAQQAHDYELWIIRGDQKIAAGLLHGDEDGRAVAEIDGKLLAGGVDAFAVTLEPEGGGTTPRGALLLVGTVKKG